MISHEIWGSTPHHEGRTKEAGSLKGFLKGKSKATHAKRLGRNTGTVLGGGELAPLLGERKGGKDKKDRGSAVRLQDGGDVRHIRSW